MTNADLNRILTRTVDELSAPQSLKGLFHQHREGFPLPSGRVLEEIVSLSRSIIFPGYFGRSTVNTRTIRYHIGVDVERLVQLLAQQIMAAMGFAEGDDSPLDAASCARRWFSRYRSSMKVLESFPS